MFPTDANFDRQETIIRGLITICLVLISGTSMSNAQAGADSGANNDRQVLSLAVLLFTSLQHGLATAADFTYELDRNKDKTKAIMLKKTRSKLTQS